MTQRFFWLLILLVVFVGCSPKTNSVREFSNVSYDPTREIYKEYNDYFIKHWKKSKGEDIKISQAHAGSGAQAKNVIDGKRADVVTLALAYDIDLIANKAKLLPENWQSRLPNNSCPYTSLIVFLVRKGNPKGINDWNDLLKENVEIITPDPKTSGGARWNYMAAWGYALKKELGDFSALKDPAKADQVAAAQVKAREFVKNMFKNVKSMDSGARGSSVRFVQQKKGDVLLAWENEALYFQKMEPAEGFEIVIPSLTILAEPPVAMVDKVVERYKTQDIAEEYLKMLYEPFGQEIVARNFYRPSNPEIMAKYSAQFPKAETFTVADGFGTWLNVQREHFNADAIFDQIMNENVK